MSVESKVSTKKPTKVCHYWTSPTGCFKGDKCVFLHPVGASGRICAAPCCGKPSVQKYCSRTCVATAKAHEGLFPCLTEGCHHWTRHQIGFCHSCWAAMSEEERKEKLEEQPVVARPNHVDENGVTWAPCSWRFKDGSYCTGFIDISARRSGRLAPDGRVLCDLHSRH